MGSLAVIVGEPSDLVLLEPKSRCTCSVLKKYINHIKFRTEKGCARSMVVVVDVS